MAHGNNTIPVPGELRSEATGSVTVAADGVKDYLKGKFQEQINTEVDNEIANIKGGSTDSIASLKTAINNEKSRAQSAESGLQNSINTEKNRAEGAESNLQNAVNTEKTRAEGVEATKANAADVYTKAQGTAFEEQVNGAISQQNATINSKFAQQDQLIDERLDEQDEKIDTLERQDIEVVEDHEAVENPDPKKIYREPSEDGTSYTDWMYQNGWQELATYEFPGIEDEPTPDSLKIVSSRGLAATYGSYEQSPEFIDVKLDANDKIIEGVKEDGTKVFGGDVQILGSLDINGAVYRIVENPEWLKAVVDSDNKLICGIDLNGKLHAQLDGVDKDLLAELGKIFGTVDTPEFISVELDADNKIISGRKLDGTKFENVGLEFDGGKILGIEDLEGRRELKLDSGNKVISYRDKSGTLHEEAGIESSSIFANKLSLSPRGMTEFQQALKDSGFQPGGSGDWSDAESLEIPIPRCAVVNISNENKSAIWPTSKTDNYQYLIEFWDMQGNYFKKPIIFNAQGNSSLGMPKKNGGMDIFADTWDGEAFTLKIGNWVPQDSFHLKAYYADYFVGVCPIGYKLFDQMAATRDIFTNRDWKKALLPSKANIGTGCRAMEGEDDKYSLDNDARCFPDGFPCIVYLNGEFYGVYSWQLKKHRDNYMMSKKKTKHIHLDGVIDNTTLFGANGDASLIAWVDTADNGFEIRNPKPKKSKDGWDLTCIDGTKYDADTNMKEIIGQDDPLYDPENTSHVKTNETKQAILTLSTYLPELQQMENSGSTAEQIRTRMSEMFDIQSFVDYIVFGDIIGNFDGFRKNWQWITYNGTKWFIEPYDLDGIFGWSGWGEIVPSTGRYGNSLEIPSGWIIKYFTEELESRYAELRSLKVFYSKSILSLFTSWISAIGTDNYQKNHDKWPIDRDHYYAAPVDRHYDNIYRVSNWLDARINKCDEIYNYNV